MLKTKISKIKLLLAAALLALVNVGFIGLMSANAATLTNTTIRLSRIKAGTDSTLRVIFKTTSSEAGATGLTVDFTSAWTTNSGTINATQAISGTAGCDESATALPGSPTASGSGHVITVSSVTALAASTLYCFDLTTANAVHTPTAGTYQPVITETGAGSDSTTVGVDIISNDQIAVNATLPPSFTFALNSGCGSNQDNFTANLATSGTNSTTGCTWQVDTNAKTGWFAWAYDNQTGLHSTAASKTISSTTPGSNATLSNGTEGYVMGVTSVTQGSGSGGTTSASNPYGNNSGGTAGSYQGSGLDSTARLIASSTGTANAAQFVTKEYAAISGVTPAANDYTDTITFVASGSF